MESTDQLSGRRLLSAAPENAAMSAAYRNKGAAKKRLEMLETEQDDARGIRRAVLRV